MRVPRGIVTLIALKRFLPSVSASMNGQLSGRWKRLWTKSTWTSVTHNQGFQLALSMVGNELICPKKDKTRCDKNFPFLLYGVQKI